MKKSRILLSTFLASAVVLAGCSSKTENSSSSSNKTEQKEEKKNGCIINLGHGKNHAPDFNSIYKKTNIQ